MMVRLTKRQAESMGIPATPAPKKLRKETRIVKIADAADRRAKTKAKKGPKNHVLMDAQCEANGLPTPVYEYPFHPERKWRFDLLFDGWLAVEIQGGLFVEGRHTNGAELIKEYEKVNEAQIMGYTVLLVTPDQVQDGSAFALVRRALEESQ